MAFLRHSLYAANLRSATSFSSSFPTFSISAVSSSFWELKKETPLFVAYVVQHTSSHYYNAALFDCSSVNKVKPSKPLFQITKGILDGRSLLRVALVIALFPCSFILVWCQQPRKQGVCRVSKQVTVCTLCLSYLEERAFRSTLAPCADPGNPIARQALSLLAG